MDLSKNQRYFFKKTERKNGQAFSARITDGNFHPIKRTHVNVANNTDLQDIAYDRGMQNINRLENYSQPQLETEITELKKLRDSQVSGLKDIYGDAPGVRIANDWSRRASTLSHSGIDRNYRSRSRVEVPSLFGNNTHSGEGWDETIQTSIVRERAKGRIDSLKKLSGNTKHENLTTIHQLMTETSSLSRVLTAGVAGSLDSEPGTFTAHTTSSFYKGGGVGMNPTGHRARTVVMQKAEEDYMQAHPKASMAELQQTRIQASLSATNQIMSAPTVAGKTNATVLNKAKKPRAKASAMHIVREGVKVAQVAIGKPPSSPRRTRADAANAVIKMNL